MPQFKSFRSRILSFFLGLIIVIQVSSLYFVDYANTQNARVLVGEALNATSQSFRNQIVTRNIGLTQAGRLLSGDFAFKTAFASASTATISTALDNHRRRVSANLMFLLSIEGKLVASSGSNTAFFKSADGMFYFPEFIDKAILNGEASSLVSIDNEIYSLIAVPLLTPVPAAWIVLGFQIDDELIKNLQSESHSHISLLTYREKNWEIGISTLSLEEQNMLAENLGMNNTIIGETFDLASNSATYFTFIEALPSSGNSSIYAILQRNSNDALAPYYRLRMILITLLMVALIISILAGGAIASSVTRPVQSLVHLAGQIQKGEYQNKIDLYQKDELGQLASAFNDMSKGLYERDKVRNLLGKVISPEIAEELINKDVKLGGEEKEMTILFTDLRNFTGMSEKRPPAEVLSLLNEYLTRMTGIIDKYGGVVDKYIGDAIMALFGAPLDLPEHAQKAVSCAIEMNTALSQLNLDFEKKGLPTLEMGIGINTGNVVVGNMGSRDRLNYTVIGDNVNLASRLESITKEYQVPIIVSEATRLQSGQINFRKLGRINVKGKQDQVTIYTPT